jgi:hypothetical protein
MTDWKYIAQRALTGEWIDRSGIPVISDTLTWDLDTDAFQGTIDPQYYGLIAPDGSIAMDPWSTFIYAEKDNQIQWGGLLTVSDFTGPTWAVQATGFRGYPSGQIYNGAAYSLTNGDPLNAYRFIWSYLQGLDNGNLGLNVPSTATPVRIGSVPSAVDVTPQTFPKSGATSKNTTLYPVVVTFPSGFATDFKLNGVAKTWPTSHEFTLQPGDTFSFTYTDEPDWTWTSQVPTPYALNWWNGTDLGQELANLATISPFDVTESHQWNASQTDVEHSLNFGYPRVGTRRNDLRFVEGENIALIPELDKDGTQYSNVVIAYGSGSGSTQTHWQSGQQDTSRLRRSYAYTNASVTTSEQLSPLARADLQSRVGLGEISQIAVMNHPHAPFGSFRAGDDILLQLRSGWMRGQSIWHRITSYNYSTRSDTLVLTVQRSDSFSYAQGDLTTLGSA